MAELQPFQQRVVAERDELAERTQKLIDFMGTPAFEKVSCAEQIRMRKQAKAMTDYGNVMAERIANFTGPDDELVIFNRVAIPTDSDPMCRRGVDRVAMDAREVSQHGIPALPRGYVHNIQHVFRRDFEAGDQFRGVILL